jgi:hypothetical protein
MLGGEHVSMNMNLWAGTNIFGIFWWQGQNIFRIPLCRIGMTWKIIFHMYMDESFLNGWNVWMKVEHQWTFWMIITSKRIVWIKIWQNVRMKLILK